MKLTNIKTVLSLIMIGIVAAGLIAACGSGSSESQIVVVTATSTPTPNTVSYTTAEATPTVEPQIEPTAEVEAEPTPVTYEAGTLLKASGHGVFYLTEDSTRQHIYDWPTFLAFGFAQEDIVILEDEVLEAIPLAGELTRLVVDAKDNLFWVADGRLWKVNEWRKVVDRESDKGVLVTPLDSSLRAALSGYIDLRDGMLLREDDIVYYFARPGNVTSRNANVIPVPAGLYDEANVLDVPSGVLAVYKQKSRLEQVNIRLNVQTQAANVREGHSLQYEVIGVVQRNDQITALGRTADGNWVLIESGDQLGWLAGDLVEETLALNLLPIANTDDLPEAQPAAVTQKSEPQPIYCNDTPLRGFGKVWGDHLDVQNTLGCPYGSEQGTNAAVQTFQHGLMLWLEADSRYNGDPVYVFFDDGSYQRFGDLGAADPAKVETVPGGFYTVGDRFSKVYWEGTGARVKERLGYATGEAQDTAGAYQSFSNGRMFWAETVDRIFVIYDYYYYDEDDNYIRVRMWASYEDTF